VAHGSLDEQAWTWKLALRMFKNVKSVGIDLDNTIIDYSAAYFYLSERFNLGELQRDRISIRNILRKSKFDDDDWQYFQSLLYTEGLVHAKPAEGLLDFLNLCKHKKVEVSIISHKTATTQSRFGSQDLRKPALEWLQNNTIIPKYISESEVIFCNSAEEKVALIKAKSFDIFVDDLIEILLDLELASSLNRVLFESSTNEVLLRDDGIYSSNFVSLTQWI
jgi:predicted secreted acid phosphatase